MKNRNTVFHLIALVVILLLSMVVPIVLEVCIFENKCYSAISNDSWASFLGGYTGGICTLIAVYLTIAYNRIENRNAIIRERKNSEIEKRDRIRPYLHSQHNFFNHTVITGNNFYVFEIYKNHTENMRKNLSATDRHVIKYNIDTNNNEYMYIDYSVKNYGQGSAVDMIIEVNDFPLDACLSKDEEIHLLCIVKMEGKNSVDLEINIKYSDVENRARYFLKDTLSIVKSGTEVGYVTSKSQKQQLLEE